jgi:hypothetical protein
VLIEGVGHESDDREGYAGDHLARRVTNGSEKLYVQECTHNVAHLVHDGVLLGKRFEMLDDFAGYLGNSGILEISATHGVRYGSIYRQKPPPHENSLWLREVDSALLLSGLRLIVKLLRFAASRREITTQRRRETKPLARRTSPAELLKSPRENFSNCHPSCTGSADGAAQQIKKIAVQCVASVRGVKATWRVSGGLQHENETDHFGGEVIGDDGEKEEEDGGV